MKDQRVNWRAQTTNMMIKDLHFANLQYHSVEYHSVEWYWSTVIGKIDYCFGFRPLSHVSSENKTRTFTNWNTVTYRFQEWTVFIISGKKQNKYCLLSERTCLRPLGLMLRSGPSEILPEGWDDLRGTCNWEGPSVTTRHLLRGGRENQSVSSRFS